MSGLRSDEAGGVQRGQVGAGYGPYAYTAAPTGPAGAPGPSRFPSKESSSSFDSSNYNKGGVPRHNLTDSARATGPRQDTAATSFLMWDGKDDMDDALHTPDKSGKDHYDWDPFSVRGWLNALTIFVLLAGLITLFAGWPIIVYYDNKDRSSGSNTAGFNLGGINGTGQVPSISGFPVLIDTETPANAMTRTGFDGHDYDLVFSDEFNTDGRTFYPGDDPFWEAVDLHYWPTGDFEWYEPGQATTANGALVLTMTEQETYGLDFRSGMLQSWNKFCFSENAYIEVSVSLPGNHEIGGFWPGVWTMGNLGRAGYGSTTEGTWPYSYDSCDLGTLPNQTNVAGTGPTAALTGGANGGPLSYLPGQKFSACTCSGEDHPGPTVSTGRSAPEIDILEAQINIAQAVGDVSQSLQTAPFDYEYQWTNTSTNYEIYDTTTTTFNTYLGGLYQQAVSALTVTQNSNYQETGGNFGVYGFEYTGNPDDRDNGYITWVSSGVPTWTVKAAGTGANTDSQISARPIPEEPMYIILNFGMSNNFQTVDLTRLNFPAQMLIDYVRVYQRTDMVNVGCNPPRKPTSDYINRHMEAYTNRNWTIWNETGSPWPKNSLLGC